LDGRLRRIEEKSTAGSLPTPNKVAETPPTPEIKAPSDQEVYDQANALLDGLKNKEAFQAFTDFIKQFPNSALLPDAKYALANAQFNLKNYKATIGYTSGWTAGWGITDISKFLIEQSKTKNVIVGSEGYFGTFPDGLQIYTNNIPQLTVFGVNNDLVEIPEKLIEARNYGDDVYVIKNSSTNVFNPESLSKLNLIKSYIKPDGGAILLYQLI
jgi:hypothetical protein